MVRVITVNDLTNEEMKYAIDLINEKRVREDYTKRKELAKKAFDDFLKICKELNIRCEIPNGYVRTTDKIENLIKFY